MAATFSILDWIAANGLAYTGSLSGDSLKVLRVNAGETGFELAADSLTTVNATSPLVASGTTTRTLSISGLTTLGTSGQLPISNGTAWGYQSSTGAGNIVRALGPTIQTLTVTGTAFTLPNIAIASTTTFLTIDSGGLVLPLAMGTAGQSVRVNSGATAFEYFTPEVGDITSVTGTSPIIVTSGTGPTPNVTIAGLTTVGTGGQVPISNGTVWQYVSSTGTGNNVRATSPTISGAPVISDSNASILGLIFTNSDVTQSYTWGIGGSAASLAPAGAVLLRDSTAGATRMYVTTAGGFSISCTSLGFFGETPVTQRPVTQYLNTSWPNPVTDTTAFNTAVSVFLANYIDQQQALGDSSGYGLFDLV